MFTKSSIYAIRAMLFLTVNSSFQRRFKAKEIAAHLKVPQAFLAKILQQLSKQGLIGSTKGKGGGFFLIPRQKSASIRDVINSIDGPDFFDSCILGFENCTSKKPCLLHFEYQNFKEKINVVISEKNLKNLAANTSPNGFKL